ncbi:MAG: hypothetical protein GWP67_11705 [Gammaproteobacteria bacterium]|nr:hypothetical protein [Gammaproteobacteria bacterium]
MSLLVLAIVSSAEAAEMLSIEVEHEQGIYTMNSEVWFDATVEQVYEIFRYWDNSTKFSSAITESRDVEADAQGRPQFYVRNKGCVLFFCTSFERRGYVEAELNTVIYAFVDPETSDFYLSNESWRFIQRDGGTVVIYDLKMQPKFWIPPGIGPYLIKRKLRNNGGRAIDRIEVMAQAVIDD